MARSIFLSAGHSNTDPGAVANGYREADIAVEFRNMVSFYLSRAGVKHDLDGTGTENMPLSQAVRHARQRDLSVEFHCNASPNLIANGTETLSERHNMMIGSKITKVIAMALGIKDRGAKREDAGQHHRLAFVHDADGIIVELFFLTNSQDLQAYLARKWVAAKMVAGVLAEEVNR